MSKLTYFFICFVAVGLNSVYAITDAEKAAIRENILPALNKCLSDNGVSMEEFMTAKNNRKADDIKPCFLECLLKKIKFVNEQGKFDLDSATNKLKEYVKSDADIKNFQGVIQQCISVNDQPLDGCERSKAITTCYLEKKGEEIF